MRKAVFTMCRDENILLPIWLNYYSRYFSMEDIYILDNNTIDGSTSNLPCKNVWPQNNASVDFNWITERCNFWQKWFLTLAARTDPSNGGRKNDVNWPNGPHAEDCQCGEGWYHGPYDAVLYADIDEIFYHPMGLDKFIDYVFANFQGTIRPKESFEIVHNMLEEPAIDLSKPLLKQRHYCRDLVAEHGYLWQKATLTNVIVHWTPGCHETQSSYPIWAHPDYKLLHLHQMDYEICKNRHEKRNSYHWGHANGSHSKILGEALKSCFIVENKFTREGKPIHTLKEEVRTII